jgi:hypothetical protein
VSAEQLPQASNPGIRVAIIFDHRRVKATNQLPFICHHLSLFVTRCHRSSGSDCRRNWVVWFALRRGSSSQFRYGGHGCVVPAQVGTTTELPLRQPRRRRNRIAWRRERQDPWGPSLLKAANGVEMVGMAKSDRLGAVHILGDATAGPRVGRARLAGRRTTKRAVDTGPIADSA